MQAFLRGVLDADAEEEVRRHLTDRRCALCLRALNRQVGAEARLQAQALRQALRSPAGSEERAGLLRRAGLWAERRAFVKAIEDRLAPDLVRDLLLKSPRARRHAVRTGERYHLLGLAEHLVDRARAEVAEDVSRAGELASLSVEVSESLPAEVFGDREVATAQAKALAALGNVLRVRCELRDSERALRAAKELLETRGHGSATDRADLLSLLGSLRMSQARYPQAQEVLKEAVALYADQGITSGEAKVLTKLGKALEEDGAPEEAVSVLERAERLLQGEGAHDLLLFARQLRAMSLNSSGRIQEARALLERLRPDWTTHLQAFPHRQRLLWLDARITWSEGDVASAEHKFLEVQRGWEEREEAYDHALVSLELAALYLEQGRTDEVRTLAERMLPVFRSQDIHHHAVAALVLVQRAIASDTVTLALVRHVARYLHRARSNPDLAYAPDA